MHYEEQGRNDTPCILIYHDTVIKIHTMIQKIDADMYHFCMIYSIIMMLLLRNLNILKNIIYYMYHIIVILWDLYQDTYCIMAILYRFTPNDEALILIHKQCFFNTRAFYCAVVTSDDEIWIDRDVFKCQWWTAVLLCTNHSGFGWLMRQWQERQPWIISFLLSIPWGHHNMETFSSSLTLYDGNPLWFTSQRSNIVVLLCFPCWTDCPVADDLRCCDTHVTSLWYLQYIP